MIKSFGTQDTADLFDNEEVLRFKHIARRIHKKLLQIDAAKELRDLQSPGSRLEKLHGNREGQYSIRINDQWRICFVWEEGDAHKVEVADYH